MAKVELRKNNRERRKLRVRKKVIGTTLRPRLSIFRSNRYIYGQLIDDSTGKTLVSVTLNEVKQLHEGKAKGQASFELGELLAKKALEKAIKEAVFDRNGYMYHGRIKNIAEGARKGGLTL